MTNNNRPLWAPWRIDFIRSEKEKECFLCIDTTDKTGDFDNLIIARGKEIFVILNRYPYNSGHIMISPYRHIGDISEMTKSERYEMMDLTVYAKTVLTNVLNPDGFNVGFNLGTAAGAGVADHIHMHIVPRWNGDTNFMPVLAGIHVVPESLNDTLKLLIAEWKKGEK
jgi:ATP adenylyltransferase